MKTYAYTVFFVHSCIHTILTYKQTYTPTIETTAVVCLDVITDAEERSCVLSSLQRSGREVIPITSDQVMDYQQRNTTIITVFEVQYLHC